MSEKIEEVVEEAVEPSTEVEVVEDERGVAPSRDQAVQRGSEELVRFASNLRLAYNAGVSLATTAFVPQSFSGRPEQVAAAIVTGLELGLTPMAALRSMDIIQGTPALRANTLRAIVLAKGHEMWVDESTSQRAVVKGRRRGSDQVQESVWDMDRAKQMKLAGKDNWQKQPKAMLLARATSELARLIAPDDILGLSYTAEEIGDEVPVDVEPVKRSTSKVSRRKQKAKPVDKEPVKEPEPTGDAVEDEPGESQDSGEEDSRAEGGQQSWDEFAAVPEGFE